MTSSNGGDYGTRLTRLEDFVEVLTNAHMELAQQHKRLFAALARAGARTARSKDENS